MLDSGKISIVIPTYQREIVLINTLEYLMGLADGADEILVIDQTSHHEEQTKRKLHELDSSGRLRWIMLDKPCITRAMNIGLAEARHEIVLFLDDDIIPQPNLVISHRKAHEAGHRIVAGQVLQPGEEPVSESPESIPFRFNSNKRDFITEFIGCNFSVNRNVAISLGGFDENFVHVAYRYEAEFADRATTAAELICFEPTASVRHLKSSRGGTRSFGHHLTTIKPSHAVGAYYFLLRSKKVPRRGLRVLSRPFRSVRTRHHVTHPWWIPATLAAEGLGFLWAVFLYLRGPRLINQSRNVNRA